jgi:hypothetical protein
MGIEKGKHFQARAVFVDYPFESVMFRWDHETRQVFRKFYGQQEEPTPIPHDNRLYNEALTDGEEITAMQYATGKPSK